MSARHAALGMLREGPAYSYELAARIEQLLGPTYEINSGYMSLVMRKLHKAELVETVGRAPSSPDDKRIVYAITEAGRAEYEEFFESRKDTARLFRRSLLVKIALAGPTEVNKIFEQIDRYEQDCTTRRNDLQKELDKVLPDDEPRPRVDLAVIRLGLEADISQLRAELAWARHVRDVVSRLHHSGALWPATRNSGSLPGNASQARRDEARQALFGRLAERNRGD